MRRQVIHSPFAVVLIFYLLAFTGFFFYSIFTFPAGEEGLLAVFQWPYIWNNSFLLFVDHALPLTVAAVAVAYSLLPAADTVRLRSAAQPFSQLVSAHLAGFIALTVLYTVLSLGLSPLARSGRESFYYLSREARTFRRQAEEALAAGDKETALEGFRRYLSIDPGDRVVLDTASDLEMQLMAGSGEQRPEQGKGEPALGDELAEGKSSYELFTLAKGFYGREDYYSAHYYASLAFQIDPTRTDAQRLAARSWEKIHSGEPGKLEEEQKRLYERKRAGYEQFVNGEYFEAYQSFKELAGRYPDDRDVKTYLERSERRLSQEAFFLDEARAIDALPGATGLLFVNRREEGQPEIVSIGKLARTQTGTYGKDIEVVRFSPEGLLSHYTAPYGQLRAGRIVLRGVDRTEAGVETLPRYLSGTGKQRGEGPANLLPLGPPAGQLGGLKGGRVSAAAAPEVGLYSLLALRRSIGEYGYAEPFVSGEILRRLLLPFSFLLMCLFAVAAGWRFRARFSGSGHRILLVFVPLFPLVALYLVSLYLQAQQVILSFLLLRFGFGVSLTGLLVLQGVLLAGALIVLAGQRTD